ncbi:MAG: 4-hydroxybenzoate octaprenyltransferase [Steroidobacteraceae bacterium]
MPASVDPSAARASLRWRRLGEFARLMRLDKPVGIWLLLWPMLWALWCASSGRPSAPLLLIFVAGTVLMRSAGCVINDFWDRDIDPNVQRTRMRPLALRTVSPYEALVLFAVLVFGALLLVLQLDIVTLKFAFIGAGLTISYPLMKRFFPLPQLYLGLAFGWAVPMAFVATLGHVPRVGWVMLLGAVAWAGVYDTFYAMADRDDDLKLGVRSSAILFGDLDLLMIGALQLMVLLSLVLIGRLMHYGGYYHLGVLLGAMLFAWQQWMARDRSRAHCFDAFLNNRYFGAAVFAGWLLELSTHR